MFNFSTFNVTAYIHQSCIILHAVCISSIFLSKILLPTSVLSETDGLAFIKGLPWPLASCLVKQMSSFRKRREQRSRAKSYASSQWLWWGLAASLDQQVVTPDRQPSPIQLLLHFHWGRLFSALGLHTTPCRNSLILYNIKAMFLHAISWNQRLSSNIYWLSDKGLWKFRHSQFLLTCSKRKIVSTQSLDSL